MSTATSITSIQEMLLGQPPAPSEQGATGLIRRLLELLANEAVETTTNTLLGYSLVKLAREKGDSIDEAFGTIEGKSEEEAWNTFEQGVQDVYNLEGELLGIQSLLPQSLGLEPESTTDGKAGIKAWETNRKELLKHLEKFQSKATATTDTLWEQKCDDASLFRTLMRKIEPSKSQISSPHLKLTVDALNNVLTNIDNQTSDKVTIAIKIAWLLKSAISEHEKTVNESRKQYLAQDHVWTAAKSVADLLSSPAFDTTTLQAKYQEFIDKLDIIAVSLAAKTYLDLIKASIKVSRPFMARSKVLVDYSRRLVNHYNGNKSTEGEAAVTLAIKQCSQALDGARSVPLEVEVDSRTTIVKAFQDAQKQLEAALRLYSPVDTPKLSPDMEEAKKEDEDRLVALKGRSSKATRKDDNSGSVTVTIQTKKTKESVVVKGSTRVGALLWDGNLRDPENKSMVVRQVGQPDVIDLDTKVGDLTGTLELDIRGGPPALGSPQSEFEDLGQTRSTASSSA